MTAQNMTAFQGASEQRGSWPTGRALAVALLPFVVLAAIAVAIERRTELVLPAAQVVWLVLVPLALVYPFVAAIARVHAYAPTTVLVVSAIAPALALAARLLVEPVARDRSGRAIIDAAVLWDRAMPPAVVAIALFVAIEIASAGLRRGVVLGIAAGIVAAAIVGAAGVGLFIATATSIQGPA